MRYLILAGALVLTSCITTEEQRIARYHERCAGYGFTPGTDSFATCVMQQDAARRQIGAAILGAALSKQQPERRLQVIIPGTPHISCTSRTVGNTTYTNC